MVMVTDSLHPLLGKPRNRGAKDRLRRVVLATEASEFGQKWVKVESGGFIGEKLRNESAEVS